MPEHVKCKKMIVANWKMNLDIHSIDLLLKGLKPNNNVDIIICPPAIYLNHTLLGLASNQLFNIQLGAQDCSMYQKGSYTGDIAAYMLKDIGVKYVIIGHSERRELYNETNKHLVQKFTCAMAANIKPIFCIGESEAIRRKGGTIKHLIKQLECLPIQLDTEVIIAYEPIWAIGSGEAINTLELSLIFNALKQKYPNSILLYGGSIDDNNCRTFIQITELSGLLIGGASLSCEKLNNVIDQII